MLESLVGHFVDCQGKFYEIVGVTGGDAYEMGGDTVFDVFDLSNYTFHRVNRGSPLGIVSEESFEGLGIFKLRSGLIRSSNAENIQQGATLHIKPNEPFLDIQTINREHYTLTLVQSALTISGSSS